jgi:hypothetical protein
MSMTGGLPRILTLMGSGETSPTMVKVHRQVLDRFAPKTVPAVLLDTPFGFQENANELSIRVQNYFNESLHTTITNASGIDPENPDLFDERFLAEQLTTNIRRALYVFSGPGSPTYALRKWKDSVVPQLLEEKLVSGGAVTFASAAALTLGALTVPVYEVYKVGEDPHWLEGLNLLGLLGLHVAIIPHYNNTEGGTHDTHFCYLGERRLRALESMMPSDAFVLGIDEHTSCTFDLDAKTATIGGNGVVTVRKNGESVIYASGETLLIEDLVLGAHTNRASTSTAALADTSPASPEAPKELLLDLVQGAETTFKDALGSNDAPEATATILELEQSFHEWSTDSPGQDDLLRARASLRSMIAEFGQIAVRGLEDPSTRLAPFIELLLSLRALARKDRRFQEADDIRDHLVAMGIQLHDSPEGTSWVISSTV